MGSLIVCDGETPRFLQNVWGPRKHVYLQRAKAGMDSFKKQHSNVYAAILVRFDKKIEAKRKLETIEYLDEKYGLEPIYDEKGYFNLKIYKVK